MVYSWAADEMQWCVAKGYICGSRAANGTYLLPQGSATRAQVAAMLMRLCKSLPSQQNSGLICAQQGYTSLGQVERN